MISVPDYWRSVWSCFFDVLDAIAISTFGLWLLDAQISDGRFLRLLVVAYRRRHLLRIAEFVDQVLGVLDGEVNHTGELAPVVWVVLVKPLGNEDGVVMSALKPRCLDCRNCVNACPFGVPKYNTAMHLQMNAVPMGSLVKKHVSLLDMQGLAPT